MPITARNDNHNNVLLCSSSTHIRFPPTVRNLSLPCPGFPIMYIQSVILTNPVYSVSYSFSYFDKNSVVVVQFIVIATGILDFYVLTYVLYRLYLIVLAQSWLKLRQKVVVWQESCEDAHSRFGLWKYSRSNSALSRMILQRNSVSSGHSWYEISSV